MKNVHSVITVVLAIAVAVLFYLHFKKPTDAESQTAALPPVPVSTSIVYVNSDSLLDNYTFFKTKKEEFEKKEDQIKNQLKAESDKLQRDAETYQQAAATMTDNERMRKEEELMMRQQSLMKKKDDLLDAFDREQDNFNELLHAKLQAYLKDFNIGRNFTFILGYQKGGGILFANDSLDVTRQVLDGLNKAYEEEAGAKK